MIFNKFSNAKNKEGLVDETKLILQNSYGINVSAELIRKIVSIRNITIKDAMSKEVPRIIIPSIGSILIKKTRKQKLMAIGKFKDEKGIYKYKFKSVSNEQC